MGTLAAIALGEVKQHAHPTSVNDEGVGGLGLCLEMCLDTCTDMRMDMCMGKCIGRP